MPRETSDGLSPPPPQRRRRGGGPLGGLGRFVAGVFGAPGGQSGTNVVPGSGSRPFLPRQQPFAAGGCNTQLDQVGRQLAEALAEREASETAMSSLRARQESALVERDRSQALAVALGKQLSVAQERAGRAEDEERRGEAAVAAMRSRLEEAIASERRVLEAQAAANELLSGARSELLIAQKEAAEARRTEREQCADTRRRAETEGARADEQERAASELRADLEVARRAVASAEAASERAGWKARDQLVALEAELRATRTQLAHAEAAAATTSSALASARSEAAAVRAASAASDAAAAEASIRCAGETGSVVQQAPGREMLSGGDQYEHGRPPVAPPVLGVSSPSPAPTFSVHAAVEAAISTGMSHPHAGAAALLGCVILNFVLLLSLRKRRQAAPPAKPSARGAVDAATTRACATLALIRQSCDDEATGLALARWHEQAIVIAAANASAAAAAAERGMRRRRALEAVVLHGEQLGCSRVLSEWSAVAVALAAAWQQQQLQHLALMQVINRAESASQAERSSQRSTREHVQGCEAHERIGTARSSSKLSDTTAELRGDLRSLGTNILALARAQARTPCLSPPRDCVLAVSVHRSPPGETRGRVGTC